MRYTSPMTTQHEHAPLTAFCPNFHHAVEVIGRRWTGAILRAMLAGTERFSDLAATVPGLSDRLLSERLKELEAEGIVTRAVSPRRPCASSTASRRRGSSWRP